MVPEELRIGKRQEEDVYDILSDYPYTIRRIVVDTPQLIIVPWHWHAEMVFNFARKGTMVYRTPREQIVVREGEGIFVNGNILHQVLKENVSENVDFDSHLFRKNFISEANSLLDKKYICPMLYEEAIPMMHLSPEIPEQKRILDSLKRLVLWKEEKAFGYELKSRNLLSEIWLEILFLVKKQDILQPNRIDNGESRLMQMLYFIQENYTEQIKLEMIADAANISTRECLRCFQKVLHVSPFQYLQEYRIHIACGMLANDNEKVVDIALKCGFGSSSYFGKVFRKQMRCSPQEYRKGQNTGGL